MSALQRTLVMSLPLLWVVGCNPATDAADEVVLDLPDEILQDVPPAESDGMSRLDAGLDALDTAIRELELVLIEVGVEPGPHIQQFEEIADEIRARLDALDPADEETTVAIQERLDDALNRVEERMRRLQRDRSLTPGPDRPMPN